MLGLHCCAGFSLVLASGGCSLAVVCGLLTTVPSPVVQHGLWGVWASLAVAHRLSSCDSWTLGPHVGLSQTRNGTRVSCIDRQILYH